MLVTAERLAPQRMQSPLVVETVRGLLEQARRGPGWTELRGLCERVGVGSERADRGANSSLATEP